MGGGKPFCPPFLLAGCNVAVMSGAPAAIMDHELGNGSRVCRKTRQKKLDILTQWSFHL